MSRRRGVGVGGRGERVRFFGAPFRFHSIYRHGVSSKRYSHRTVQGSANFVLKEPECKRCLGFAGQMATVAIDNTETNEQVWLCSSETLFLVPGIRILEVSLIMKYYSLKNFFNIKKTCKRS